MNFINTQQSEEEAFKSERLELITDPKEILSVVSQSKEKGIAIGIFSTALGRGVYVTCVEQILLDGEIEIILKPYDITGYMLPINKVALPSIKGVIQFESQFQNPYLKDFDKSNSNVA